MHAEAMDFLQRARHAFPTLGGARVLEIGSHDVNGSARQVFTGAVEYVGIDVWPGNGVDVVADARQYDGGQAFDVAITTEALEHDPEPGAIIDCAGRALKPGGVLIITAAAPPRTPHSCAGVLGNPEAEPYGNVTPPQLMGLLAGWDVIVIEWNQAHGDIYAVAVRK